MTLAGLRELTLACLCHGVVHLALRTRFRTSLALPRVSLPRASHPLGLEDIMVAARRSRRLCRGSCLTEAIVLKWLATRHGVILPLTIGVQRTASGLRAHAWNAEDPPVPFTPIWTDHVSHRS